MREVLTINVTSWFDYFHCVRVSTALLYLLLLGFLGIKTSLFQRDTARFQVFDTVTQYAHDIDEVDMSFRRNLYQKFVY